jgi:hypothetical protein
MKNNEEQWRTMKLKDCHDDVGQHPVGPDLVPASQTKHIKQIKTILNIIKHT